jgi:hypothetical protein
MTATIGLVLDGADPDRLATFWSEALGYTTVGGAGNYVMLVAADGALPKLLRQAVPEPKTTKNGMHLDIRPRRRNGGITARGDRRPPARARRAQRARHQLGDHGRPRGNEFCVCAGGAT